MNCLQCKKNFIPKSSQKQKYCSYQCYWKSNIKKENILTCPTCKKQFLRYIKNKRRNKYCSPKCQGQGKKISAQITKICLNCDKLYNLPKHIAKIQNYCSHQCGIDGWFKTHRGENHPHWVGDSRTNSLDRAMFWKTTRKKVLERDGYKCVLCGNEKNLHIDHLIRWESDIELRFDLSNCRTLCMSCHYKVTYNKPMPKSIKRWGWQTK